ncbi:carbohydrate ABC transporter permease [Ktedonospora formicarum]|uniref:Sugar ABC transporter permease n=1 Tax=Ktedonospora formicarum TaxID=2778364 RepID=A0A8J3MUX0_9CHLR|nr:carbohydrate ABC transporter permease [Ktedonospora formicarum]GHO47351.1 sugar ABC transporter permease [Ktedonospora formicarum]
MKASLSRSISSAAHLPEQGKPSTPTRLQPNVRRLLLYITLIACSLLFLSPFLWMVSTSLKPSQEVFVFPPRLLPSSAQWHNYLDGWMALPFTRFLTNTILVTVAAIIGNLVSCALPAYAFARLRARGSRIAFMLMLATMMIPIEVTIVPIFLLYSKVHLINTLWTLIIPPWLGYPFSIFLLRQSFLNLPREMDEAARLEGATHFQILTKIVLPLSKPALGAVAIIAFVGNWNNLLAPLIYLRSTDNYTLAIGLNLFYGQSLTAYNQLMAVSVLSILPIIITFFFAQRYFIRGVALTGMDR